MAPLLIAMPGNEALAERLGQTLSWEVGSLHMRHFPDGEASLRYLSSPAGRDIVLVCTMDRPDEKFLTLYLAASIARELEATRVGLVVPYLPYMRQDARFQDGEGITSVHFARLVSEFCDWLVTVDPHLHRHHDLSEIYPIPTRVTHASPVIAKWITDNLQRPFVIGPDEESEQWVTEVAMAADCPYTVLQKVRHGDRDVEVSVPQPELLRGMTPVLVDDIVSTAHTMLAATAHLHSAGLAAPVCIGVHALFAGDAYSALQSAGVDRIVSCNTVSHPTNAIDLSGAVAASVQALLTHDADE